jgi:hypothetical protein
MLDVRRQQGEYSGLSLLFVSLQDLFVTDTIPYPSWKFWETGLTMDARCSMTNLYAASVPLCPLTPPRGAALLTSRKKQYIGAADAQYAWLEKGGTEEEVYMTTWVSCELLLV